MKIEEVTDDQLSVVHSLTQAGRNLYHISWTTQDRGGASDSIVTWEACWRVFRSCDHVRFGRPNCAGSVFRGISCTSGTFPGSNEGRPCSFERIFCICSRTTMEQEELEDKVADYRNVSRLVHKAAASSSHAGTDGTDLGHRRASRRSNEESHHTCGKTNLFRVQSKRGWLCG